MVKLVKCLLFLFCCHLLFACSTLSSADAEEQKRNISTAKINIQLGMRYLESQNVQRAKQKFLLALDEAPGIPETWYSMAYFLEVTGNKAGANSYYLKALAIAPNRGDVQNNYGTFLCRSGRYESAIHHFMLATQDPQYLDMADAYENAGLCALKIPNKNKAKFFFQEALLQDPNHLVSANELRTLNER